LEILLHQGAVNLQARNKFGQKPIDIINELLRRSPSNEVLIFAKEELTDLAKNYDILTSFNTKNR